MIALHKDGSYDAAEWITQDMYPDSYMIDENTEEGAILSGKINKLFPYYSLVVENGRLVDIVERDLTPEEETLKREQEERVDFITNLTNKLIETQSRLEQSEKDHANLLFELVDKGVL